MDYAQSRLTTLHDLTDPTPTAQLSESAVVVPITGSSMEAVTPGHVFQALAEVGPGAVVVPLRAPAGTVLAFSEWVEQFDLSVTVLWCNSDGIERVLDGHGLAGETGKGRDVWLGVGIAADLADFIAVHDADARTYDESWVPRLLAPLTDGFSFVKGYYARVEDDRLYGRLTRLFVAPLLRALAGHHDQPFVDYLGAFRYPLAGEYALTADLARQVAAQRSWGLEVGLLGEAYRVCGETECAQVDLGVHRHDHRPVGGDGGLSTMARSVGAALFSCLEDHGVTPAYDSLPAAYRDAADSLIAQYRADATFNGLSYDEADERDQVTAYAGAIEPPGPDTRLPPWDAIDLSPETVRTASRRSLASVDSVARMDDA